MALEFKAKFGSYGSGNAQFDAPLRIAVEDDAGYCYVSDDGNNRVQKLSKTGTYDSEYNEDPTYPHDFYGASGIVLSGSTIGVCSDGYLNKLTTAMVYSDQVADSGSAVKGLCFAEGEWFVLRTGLVTGTITVYNSSLVWQRTLSSGYMSVPRGIDYAGGYLWIANYGDSTILALDPSDGSFYRQWSTDAAPNDVDAGYGYAYTAEGTQVGVYGLDGTEIEIFGEAGSGDGQFDGAYGIMVAPYFGYESVFVVDTGNNRIQILGDDGDWAGGWPPTDPGEPGPAGAVFPPYINKGINGTGVDISKGIF